MVFCRTSRSCGLRSVDADLRLRLGGHFIDTAMGAARRTVGTRERQRVKTMRMFNRQVFNGTATSTEQFTDASFNDLLGGAEALSMHVHAARSNLATAQVQIKIYHSNDNKNWVAYTGGTYTGTAIPLNSVTDEILAETPMSTTNTARGAFVRLGVAMKTTGDSADVILTVCGRTR